MDKKSEDEIKIILKEHRKWKNFFDILSRRYVYVPLIVILIYLIDDSNINIVGAFIKFIKQIAGIKS